MRCYICDFSPSTTSILEESIISHKKKTLIRLQKKMICDECYEEANENLNSLQYED